MNIKGQIIRLWLPSQHVTVDANLNLVRLTSSADAATDDHVPSLVHFNKFVMIVSGDINILLLTHKSETLP